MSVKLLLVGTLKMCLNERLLKSTQKESGAYTRGIL